MYDSMDEAHKRDTRLQNDLRNARSALVALAENEATNPDLLSVVLGVANRLKREEDHIVGRWN